MKTLLASLALLCGVLGTGCASSDDGTVDAPATDELRSPTTTFFARTPLSGPRMEALRASFERYGTGYVFVRDQSSVVALQWETNDAAPLTGAKREELAQAGFSFHLQQQGMPKRDYLQNLTTSVAGEGETDALAAIGFEVSSPDAGSEAARATLLDDLRAVTATPGVSFHTAKLAYQVDMYWEGALVVVDEQNRQILIVTGGRGT